MAKDDWLEKLYEARRRRDLAIIQIGDYVRWAREEGASWEEIADELGTTRQSAWERYGRKGGTDDEG